MNADERDRLLREAGSALTKAMSALDVAGRKDLSYQALILANQVLHARQALVVERRPMVEA